MYRIIQNCIWNMWNYILCTKSGLREKYIIKPKKKKISINSRSRSKKIVREGGKNLQKNNTGLNK